MHETMVDFAELHVQFDFTETASMLHYVKCIGEKVAGPCALLLILGSSKIANIA